MQYIDALNYTVTQKEALAEVQKHGQSASEFLAEVGNKPTYKGKEILNWLGY